MMILKDYDTFQTCADTIEQLHALDKPLCQMLHRIPVACASRSECVLSVHITYVFDIWFNQHARLTDRVAEQIL
jgi:hypothetical protein